MRQYELAIRIAQVHHLVDERKYKKALAVIQTLDMRQVRSLSDLKVFAEVYTRTEQYEAAKATYLRIYRRSHTRRVLYRLIYLSIRTNALDDAEAYYQEFVRMNPNARDALILRYRIDKAAGVPIGRLIEILQELKQEEYIEEWAYELAKLYHRAGRREECMEECEDIILWFGTGEIVERAQKLIEHLEEHDPMPYYDDKDFTVPKKEAPNPDDTGSLPDLNEFIKERKAQKKEERRNEKAARKEEFDDDYENESEENENDADTDNSTENKKTEHVKNEFVDDYEENDFERESMDLPKKAMDGIQKLSGLLKLGKKDEEKEKVSEDNSQEEVPESVLEDKADKKQEYVRHSQSGTGITQDLAKEIAAIYEMEHREQLKEKAVTVINEVPNLTSNVVERMTQAIQKTTNKTYIPIDVEEIQNENEEMSQPVQANEIEREMQPVQANETEREMQPEDIESFQEEALQSADSEGIKKEKTQLENEEEVKQAPDAKVVEEAQPQQNDADLLQQLLEEDLQNYEMSDTEAEDTCKQESETEELEETKTLAPEQTASSLENYKAPDIPVVETDYMEMPEITYDELPTTRALQRSFKDVLTLIEGELDPSHFVLMGDGTERIVGVTKQIVRVMKESGYLSHGRIAKIHASQLNKMDLIGFRNQLKGNCLLIEEAADLLFPTITKLFSIMDEYHGDIVIVLADEGTTLDQLFRFVPVLAKRFKYIIDISRYTSRDYE